MKLKPIPRFPSICHQDFAIYIKRPPSPLILTDIMKEWPAMSKWSFDYFAREFADFPVIACAPQFPTLATCGVKTTLSNYVEYLKAPATASIQGDWIKGDRDLLKASDLTLYAGNFNPAHPVYGAPELIFRDVPTIPDFIDSWRDLLEPSFLQRCERLQSHYFVYLSVAGGITPLHHDFWGTHAFLAQVAGVKNAILFAPKYADELYTDLMGDVRQMMENPRFDHIPGWSATLGPGDLLIMPSRWLHYVETVEASITYSADWIDANNWREYVAEGTKALAQRELRP